MYSLVVVVLLISFLLAALSLIKEKGTSELEQYRRELHKSKIKGTIVLEENNQSKHYSSYS